MSDWDVVSTTTIGKSDDPWAVVSTEAPESLKYTEAAQKIRDSEISDLFKESAAGMMDEKARRISQDLPKWDIFGDIGRAASPNLEAMGDAFNTLNPFSEKNDDRFKDTGSFAGNLKRDLSATLETGKALGTIPLTALGTLMSPITGAARSTLGSAFSYLPGMDKQTGDEWVDQMMMGAMPVRGRLPPVPARAPSPNVAPFSEARQVGYVVHPADAKVGGVGTNALAGLGGKVKTQQLASVKNQEVTNRLAKEALGLPESTVLDEAAFDKVRAEAGKSYQALKDTSKVVTKGLIKADDQYLRDIAALDERSAEILEHFPNTPKKADVVSLQKEVSVEAFSPEAAIEKIKQLRYEATRNLKAGYQSPALEDLGLAQRKAANALEELMDRHLKGVADDATLTSAKVDPNTLTARNVTQQSVAKVGGLPAPLSVPVVVVRSGNKNIVIDGAKRVALAKQQGQEIPTISISKGRYDKLKDAGFTDMEIVYGALDSGGYTTAAADLAKQFPKSDISQVGPALSKEFSKYAQIDKDLLIDAVKNYQEARRTIAKAHTVEDATDALGNVDARKLSALGRRAPLSGPLRTIAETAEKYPKSMQNPAKFGGEEKLSVLDIGAMAASAISAMASGNPAFTLGLAVPAARPAARSLVLSNYLQNRLAGLNPQQGGGAGNFLRSIPPAAGSSAMLQPQPQGQ